MAVTFKKTSVLSGDEWNIDATTTAPATKFTEWAVQEIKAQQERFFGNGAIVNGVDDRGKLKIDLKDDSDAEINGTVRITVSDANRVNRKFLKEERTEDLREGIRLGYTEPGAKQDSLLILEVQPDSQTTIDQGNSSGSVPLTVTNLISKILY